MAVNTNKNSKVMATRTAQRSGTRPVKRRGGWSRDRKLIAVIAVLAVALIGTVGVAVAAFSTDLYIRGTATVRSTVWDIHFEQLQPVTLTGTKAHEITAPTIQTSINNVPLAAIKNYEVELKDPGDAVEYTFDVVNAGDLDAEITAVTINSGETLSCTSAAGQEVANRVCAKLRYTLTYADGANVAVGDALPSSASGNNRKTMKLKLEFDPTATHTDLPDKDVAVSGLAVIVSYGQVTE